MASPKKSTTSATIQNNPMQPLVDFIEWANNTQAIYSFAPKPNQSGKEEIVGGAKSCFVVPHINRDTLEACVEELAKRGMSVTWGDFKLEYNETGGTKVLMGGSIPLTITDMVTGKVLFHTVECGSTSNFETLKGTITNTKKRALSDLGIGTELRAGAKLFIQMVGTGKKDPKTNNDIYAIANFSACIPALIEGVRKNLVHAVSNTDKKEDTDEQEADEVSSLSLTKNDAWLVCIESNKVRLKLYKNFSNSKPEPYLFNDGQGNLRPYMKEWDMPTQPALPKATEKKTEVKVEAKTENPADLLVKSPLMEKLQEFRFDIKDTKSYKGDDKSTAEALKIAVEKGTMELFVNEEETVENYATLLFFPPKDMVINGNNIPAKSYVVFYGAAVDLLAKENPQAITGKVSKGN